MASKINQNYTSKLQYFSIGTNKCLNMTQSTQNNAPFCMTPFFFYLKFNLPKSLCLFRHLWINPNMGVGNSSQGWCTRDISLYKGIGVPTDFILGKREISPGAFPTSTRLVPVQGRRNVSPGNTYYLLLPAPPPTAHFFLCSIYAFASIQNNLFVVFVSSIFSRILLTSICVSWN